MFRYSCLPNHCSNYFICLLKTIWVSKNSGDVGKLGVNLHNAFNEESRWTQNPTLFLAKQKTKLYKKNRQTIFFPYGILIFFFFSSVVNLQCCVNFCYTAKWFSFKVIYIFQKWYVIFLFFHPICTSLYPLIPDSQSILPLTPLTYGSPESVLHVFESVSVS